MASEWATGKLKLVGGRLCLDFVNTVYARAVGDGLPRGTRRDGYSPGDDKLTSYGDLVAWGARAGVLSDKEARRLLRAASGQPKNSETVLKRAVKLREAIYRIFLMKLLGKRADEADLRTVNEELRAAKDHERLLPKGDRVRQCGGENCGWLFLDTSRNRSRQWCDMRDCGNLAKVRRFRQRRQER
jgi:predicted RNA-binding Zn ribbon-like protein